MDIQHLLFDNDGTLIDSEILAIRTMLGMLREHGFEMDERSYGQQFPGHLEREIIARLKLSHGLVLPSDFLERLHAAHAINFNSVLQAIPGIPALFSVLQVPKSIVSNASKRHVEHCLNFTGLAQHFDGHIFSAEQVSNPKPAPDVYLLALETLGLRPENTVVIEDSPVGVRAAKAAGIKTIGFLGASHIQDGHEQLLFDAGADWVVSDSTALGRLFQRWDIVA
jgi:beta-phosphoglucomutase-like phosphatase (HAD superfamily)